MGYGNGALLKKNGRQKFYGNYFPKYVLPKIFNVIPEKVELCIKPTTFLNAFI